MKSRIFSTILLFLVDFACAESIVIAHRGASGYYPEHTLKAYQAAIDMGADFIEPDLVVTKDGVLIARHDLHLSKTTNVENVYPERAKTIDGKSDWYTSDFTLAEIRALRARQPMPERTKDYDNQFGIPTLGEIIELLQANKKRTGRKIGLYPEIKSPAYHKKKGFDMGAILLAELAAHDIDSPVYIQSFDPDSLRELDGKSPYPLVMLLVPKSREEISEPNIPLEDVAEFADGIGVMKYVLSANQSSGNSLVEQAHDLGLFVHAWTFRDDRLPPGITSPEEELSLYLSMGVDGVFTDFPDSAIRARHKFSGK